MINMQKKVAMLLGRPIRSARARGKPLMAAVTELAPIVGILAACPSWLCRGRRSTASFPSRPRPRRRGRPARSVRKKKKPCSPACTKNDSKIARPPPSMRRCSTKADITARSAPCTALLGEHGETRERRDQLTHPPYQKPELLATAPNQLWSWDITNC